MIFKKKLLVFSLSNHITRFINFYRIIKEKGSLYLFAILNTYRSSQPETHWWNIWIFI